MAAETRRLLEPQKDPPDADSESGDVGEREVELPFLPISASEARKFVAAAPAGESNDCEIAEIAEVVDPLCLPPTVSLRYRPRSRGPGRSRSSGRRRVPEASTGSTIEEALRSGMFDVG
ncbi:hypothetical protein [Brevibacterium sp. UCMA 11754]|uniref:hypothetical protein n=1 Tax=Brevibacterium sp. UCMA 11754 TaxID=2749198 RepID=UPI001F41AB54|nr:hypothetical protein [Brevibacterium sp. UCMA 11754]